MYTTATGVLLAMAIAAMATPALAGDCAAAARSAMLTSGHQPRSLISTKTDAQGKQSVTRQIQTETDKFVQLPNGQWYSMGIAIKDLNDDTATMKLTCRSSASDLLNGEPTVVYQLHTEVEGFVTDNKTWVSAKNLILKSETSEDGARISTLYDYGHVTPPANAKPMGVK